MKSLLSIIALIAVLFVSVQYAEAEPLIIQANDEDKVISIMIDGEDSVIKYQSDEGSFEAWDSTIKLFKSGFVLKNSETGTVVFARELNNDTWKLTVNTFQGWTKFIGFTVSESSERIEPKSSIGSDISRYDIPTDTGRYEPSDEIEIGIRYAEAHSIFLNDEYVPTIEVKNQNQISKGVKDVAVTVEVSRDGNNVKTKSGTTGFTGKWNPVIAMTYPTFYPGFCYDVTITATYGNQTAIETDDFLVITSQKYWEYGEEYSLGRDNIEADYDCNE